MKRLKSNRSKSKKCLSKRSKPDFKKRKLLKRGKYKPKRTPREKSESRRSKLRETSKESIGTRLSSFCLSRRRSELSKFLKILRLETSRKLERTRLTR